MGNQDDPVRRFTLSDPASSEVAIMQRFFDGVKTYVDERLAELGGQAAAAPGPRDISEAELDERFNAHVVNEVGMNLINVSRGEVYELAMTWLALLPPGRDKSLAYTALEQASFHATAAISRQKGNQS